MWTKISSVIFRFRVEEFIPILFFLPMTYFTFKAYFFFRGQGHVPNAIEGGVARWIVTILVFFAFLAVIKLKPQWRLIRDGLPFGFCIAIYTNLHDTIHFANPHDVHNTLIKIDQFLFGAQPCVWSEKFITPFWTDFFTFFYVLFFVWAPLLALILYLKNDRVKFRYTMVGVILAFYIGYLGYVLFPAAPPRIVLAEYFTKTLHGLPFLDQVRNSIDVFPSTSRGAFPSLHAGATLVALFFAWKYLRWYFWLVLPFAIGLITSTIYLRHHYVIDLIAGLALAYLAVWLGPRVERGWTKLQDKCAGRPAKEGALLTKSEAIKV
jgi:membrane-associated phospholipid phosphatase